MTQVEVLAVLLVALILIVLLSGLMMARIYKFANDTRDEALQRNN